MKLQIKNRIYWQIHIHPTDLIPNILKRPGMYCNSSESLESTYWALNCIRGTHKEFDEFRTEYLRNHLKSSIYPISSVIKDLHELAIILNQFEKKIIGNAE